MSAKPFPVPDDFLLHNAESRRDLAARYGVSAGMITIWRNRLGIVRKQRKKKDIRKMQKKETLDNTAQIALCLSCRKANCNGDCSSVRTLGTVRAYRRAKEAAECKL